MVAKKSAVAESEEISVTGLNFEEFGSEEFAGDGRESYPWVMVLPKPNKHGFFTTKEQCELAGMHNLEGFKAVRHETKGGIELDGVIISNPRILVVRVGELLRVKEDKIAGKWQKGDKEKGFKCTQKILFFFVDDQNNVLHEIPFAVSAKGTFQWSFSTAYKGFTKELQTVWNKASGQKGVKGQRFFCLSVFQFETGSEMKGTGTNTNPACVIKGYTKPTPENLQSLFAGINPKTKEVLLEYFDNTEEFGKWESVKEEPKEVTDVDAVWAEFLSKCGEMKTTADYEGLKAMVTAYPIPEDVRKEMLEQLEEGLASLEIEFD